jgi:hypothetical protein
MTKPSLIAAGVVVLALSELVRGADEARFYPPQGWTVAKQPNAAAIVQPPDVPAGKTCTVMIMPDVQGEVNGVFATSWRTLTDPLKIVSGGEPRARRTTARELESRSTTATVDAPDTGRAYMHFFAVQAGPNVRRVLFVADDQATFDKHLPAIKAMLDSVGVDPTTAKLQASTAPTSGPDFEGVFYRGSVAFDAAGGRGELGQRVDYLCFAPDGRAYNGHPSGGPSACFENEDPRSPSYGRYTLNGDEIVIKWNKQENTQKLKRRADGKLEHDGVTFHALESCDGVKLDGTYTVTWADKSRTQVRFFKDGRFKATGLQDCVNLDQLVYPDWPKLPAAGTGTYAIRRNTLEVKYDNGGPTRRMFFTTPDDPANPRRISIANHPLEREP